MIKCGWEHIDNSTLMLLRLLDVFEINSIAIAGFDGYCYENNNSLNYATSDLELSNVRDDPKSLNAEISAMLSDFMNTRKHSCKISFITESRFSSCMEKEYD